MVFHTTSVLFNKKAVKGFLFFRSINHRLTSINDLVGKAEAIVTVPFASVAVIIH